MNKYWNKNKTYIKDGIGYIVLTDNKGNYLDVVMVDKADLIKCYKHKWHLNSGGYAFCNKLRQTIGRFILDVTDSSEFVCPLNTNKMDNRRKNLNIELI